MKKLRTHRFDRVIVHQFDPARPSPGGIDTCLRGLANFRAPAERLAFIGVDTGGGPATRKLGKWERHESSRGTIAFLPVVRLDPGDQSRRIPHSLRLVLGLLRYAYRVPRASWIQAHRMDTGLLAPFILGGRRAYFVHTQQGGLTGDNSDSFWRRASCVHEALERLVVKRAEHVVVFNEAYSKTVRSWNPRTRFSPTWYDPDLVKPGEEGARNSYRLVWVGRLEVPKDPGLAIAALEALVTAHPQEPWTLDMLGSGTLLRELEEQVAAMPVEIGNRITLRGRVGPDEVAASMSRATAFVMTSHPGYEGFPRVLVEALATGLPAVVTEGSDTGGLVEEGRSGFVVGRDPRVMAEQIRNTRAIDRHEPRAIAERLSAPEVIGALYADAGER